MLRAVRVASRRPAVAPRAVAAVAAVPRRSLAKKGGGAKKKGGAAKAAPVKKRVPGVVDMDFLQVFKQQEIPEVKPDSEYPEWLFNLDGMTPTFSELKKDIANFDNWDDQAQKSFVKVVQRGQIKIKNEENKSG